MKAWGRAVSLFHEIALFDAKAEARRQRCELATQGLLDWYVRSEQLLLDALRIELEQRVLELGGVRSFIRVAGPSAPRVFPQGDVSLRFLDVHFGEEVVTAYSMRRAGDSLMLHWAWQIRAVSARFPRILSVPGVRVRRGSEQEMLLDAVGIRAHPMGLPDIAGEILAMLAEAAASRRRLPLIKS